MSRINEIIKKNKLYVVLLLFIIGINALVILSNNIDKPTEEVHQQTPVETTDKDVSTPETLKEEDSRRKVFSEDEVAARQGRLEDLAKTNPRLYMFLGLLNLLILFVIFVGFIFDIGLGIRFLKTKSIARRIGTPTEPKWGIPDVVRVTLIFLSLGYVFLMVQGLFFKVVPILGNENFNMVFSTAVMNIVGISVIFHFVVRKHNQPLEAVGLKRKGFVSSIRYAIAGYIALLPVLVVIMIATFYVTKLLKYEAPVQPIVELFMEEKQTLVLWISILFAAIFGPVAEEIFFRGFMYPAVKKKIGMFWGILLTSAIFSLLHAHAVGFFPILALGFLLTYLYEKTGSLVAPMAVHITHNLAMVILVFLMRHAGVV